MIKRVHLAISAALCSLLSAHAFSQPFWPEYAGNPQHTAQVTTGVQSMKAILWQTPVDLFPPYSGSDLLIHYGSTLIASGGTVVVTVRTGPNSSFPTSNDTFRVEGHDPGTGATLWTESTDFTTPPHDWVPSCGSCIAPGNQLYTPGAGGTVWVRSNADSASANVNQLCFYGLANYQANQSGFNGNVWVSTPITVDSSGNIFFGFLVNSGFSNAPGITSGIARISSTGVGTWVSASAASGVSGQRVPLNCAPALSNDGKYVYVAAEGNAQMLLRLDSTTLATVSSVNLIGPNGVSVSILDDGTPTPMVGPDGDVYYGTWYPNDYRGFMLHYSGDLSQTKTPGAFGWDDTASVVPASCVPSYTGSSSYLILTKYNNYINAGDGMNHVAVLDPNATETYVSGQSFTTMKEVITLLGPTPNPSGGVDEWCINTAAIDVLGKAAIVNSEDGHSYRWDFTTNSITNALDLAPPTGEAYTPTMVSADGIAFAVNNAQLCAMWDGAKPTQVTPATSAVVGGTGIACTVTLSDVASGPGATVLLSSDNADLHVPASVLVPAGQNSATFNITTTAVNTNQTARITANRYGFSASSGLVTVAGPALASLTNSTNPVYGNQVGSGTVTLVGNVGTSGGEAISLSSDLPSITFPTNPIVVAQGASSATFTYNAAPVSATVNGHIIATLDNTSVSATATNHAALVTGFTLSPSTVVGGTSTQGTLSTQYGIPTAGINVNIGYTSHTRGPSPVNIGPSGSANFTINTLPVTSTGPEVLSATFEGVTKNVTITLTPPGTLVNFTVDNTNPYMTDAVHGTVTLSSPATGNIVMNAVPSDSFIVIKSYPTVFTGQTQGTFKMWTAVLSNSSSHTTTVTVTFNGVSMTQSITIHQIFLVTAYVTPNIIHSGQSATGTITTTQPAGDYPLPIKIYCPSKLVTVPTAAYAPPGSNTANFTVTAASGIVGNNRVQIYIYLAGSQRTTFVTVEP